MQLTKLTVIALFSIAAIGCSNSDRGAAPTAAGATPTAAVAQAAPAAPHECTGAAQHEGGNCGDMTQQGQGCNQWDEAAQKVTARKVPEGAIWASYVVDGMHCGGCERRIQAKVGEIDGVVAVEASAELGKVRVAVAPSARASQDLAKARIAELGYKVR